VLDEGAVGEGVALPRVHHHPEGQARLLQLVGELVRVLRVDVVVVAAVDEE
jgi:hypothetical protein